MLNLVSQDVSAWWIVCILGGTSAQPSSCTSTRARKRTPRLPTKLCVLQGNLSSLCHAAILVQTMTSTKACTDPSVTNLLYGNGWLRSKYWEMTNDANGRRKAIQGPFLICDGGYHRWPCLVYPVKVGKPGSTSMKFSKLIESVYKAIEDVYKN